MPKTLHYFTDGATVKNIDLPQYPDSAWNWITGNPDDTSDEQLYSRVSAVYRVANMTADACANVPFAIMRGEVEVDNSESWQNTIGFMENPRELLRLWRLSLFMTNSAYGLLEDGARQRSRLRYIVPTSITPVVDKWNGLTGFTRQLGSEKRDYSLKDGRIFWMWRLDHTTELLPSDNSEFKALMAAAGVLYYADYYVQNFFQRGGIKPALLQVSGVQTREEREKIESVWDKIVHGWYKYLGKVISADTMAVTTIGDGIDNLTGSQLHDEKLADIAMAAGMPLSLILANSANYATAQTEYAVWFRDTVTPWLRFIEGELNSKLFAPMGLRWEFRPEASDHGQEEEVQRASAYASYISAGMKPSIAAQVLGIELPEGVEYEQLDPEPEPEPEPAPEPVQAVEVEDEEKSLPTVLTIEQLRELEHWQDIAFRKLKQGKSLDFPWVCKTLPEDIAIGIRERLPDCRTEKDIERAFEMNARDDDADALKALADALNRAVEKVMPVAEASEAISA